MLHNQITEHASILIEHEKQLKTFWINFFKDISESISHSENIKQVSFTFESEITNSGELRFDDIVFHRYECAIDDIWDDDTFTPELVRAGISTYEHNLTKFSATDIDLIQYINKVCSSMLPKFIHDLNKLDCDDWIIVTPTSVQSNFRKYNNWNVSITNGSEPVLF